MMMRKNAALLLYMVNFMCFISCFATEREETKKAEKELSAQHWNIEKKSIGLFLIAFGGTVYHGYITGSLGNCASQVCLLGIQAVTLGEYALKQYINKKWQAKHPDVKNKKEISPFKSGMVGVMALMSAINISEMIRCNCLF